jgi:hypothetical protein
MSGTTVAAATLGHENDRLALAWCLTNGGVRCRSRSALNRPANGATNLARAAI